MRIFKSEVDTMREGDGKKGEAKPPASSPPLSGRVVDEPSSAPTTTPESTGDERR
jgi:hypothetical protein